jgi:hypothetical protein
VGKRNLEGDGWADQSRLARTAAFLRGDPDLVPRGVFRYSSFEEAEAWMSRMMIVTHARRKRTTLSASADR